jgi:c-di-GMP-binding flagellar brake protein YcgR
MAKSRTVLKNETDLQGFTKITDPIELHRALVRAVESAVKVDVRLPDQKIEFESVIHETSNLETGFRIEIPAEIKNEDLKVDLTNVMLIAFMRGQSLLCVHSQKVRVDGRFLVVAPPWSIFKLQRRKEPRYQIPAAYDLFVSMESPDGRRRVQKRVLDISEHGMGFQVTSMREAAPFRKGMFLRKMEVVIENRQIYFDARIANVLHIINDPHRAGVKIGVEVIRMSPLDRHFIASYVARNLVQIYT